MAISSKKALQQGPLKEIQALIRHDHFKSEQVAAILDMSDRTFRRKLEAASFDRLEAERLEEINQLISLGVETFGTTGKFMVWMQSTPETFGGARPMDLLASQKGIDWIEETLIALQHGLPE